MRIILSLSFALLFSLPLRAQQMESYRSDTLNFSLQLRYLLFSIGGGVEFPFRQHSFGLQLGQNYLPPDGNWFMDFNAITLAAAEYKRYISNKHSSASQFYYGSHVLFKYTDYGSPEEVDWEGHWYKSKSINIGPLVGWKVYPGRRIYFELYGGLYGGWQWGDLRFDNRDPVSRDITPTYQKAGKGVWGSRVGISLGLHPFSKKSNF